MNGLKNLPDISFIIPTYNAGFHIECCLRSIRSQNHPQEKIEIIVLDGGSYDDTIDLAKKYNCRILKNPKRLAEYGVQMGVLEALGNFLVIFAADNELFGNDWVKKVLEVLNSDEGISAVWGRLASGKGDSSLNKYFTLIQSDPLNWFLNKNLNKYKKNAQLYNKDCFIFKVTPNEPLVWGANGLVYRRERINEIWTQDGYLGDNDAFQSMIEQRNNKVAYFDTPFVYHHHVAKFSDWIVKWRRNFTQHFLDKVETRNMNWIFTNSFKLKLFFWILYSLIPIFSFFDSLKNMIRDHNIYWLYHAPACFLQTLVYVEVVFITGKWGKVLNLMRLKHPEPLRINNES